MSTKIISKTVQFTVLQKVPRYPATPLRFWKTQCLCGFQAIQNQVCNFCVSCYSKCQQVSYPNSFLNQRLKQVQVTHCAV
mgnify:CR=1 FL=1